MRLTKTILREWNAAIAKTKQVKIGAKEICFAGTVIGSFGYGFQSVYGIDQEYFKSMVSGVVLAGMFGTGAALIHVLRKEAVVAILAAGGVAVGTLPITLPIIYLSSKKRDDAGEPEERNIAEVCEPERPNSGYRYGKEVKVRKRSYRDGRD